MALGTIAAARARIGEHGFPTLGAMLEGARAQRAASAEHAADGRGVLFTPEGVDLGGGLEAHRFTDWALRQAGTLAGVPAAVLDRLQPGTRARVLNETFPREDARRWLLETGADGATVVRSITSTGYRRVWDADLLGEVERWMVPAGWEPAYPERTWGRGPADADTAPRALWRSDRESFAFFMSARDMTRGDDGSADVDGLGGMRRGLWIGNSETGARSLSWGSFWFRAMCCNFLVWDASEVAVNRRRHTAGVVREVAALRSWIRDAVPVVVESDLAPFRRLDAVPYPVPERIAGKGRKGSGLPWAERLALDLADRFPGITQSTGREAAALAERGDGGARAGSWWAVVNGLTAAARERTAGDRFDLSRAAGLVLARGLETVGA